MTKEINVKILIDVKPDGKVGNVAVLVDGKPAPKFPMVERYIVANQGKGAGSCGITMAVERWEVERPAILKGDYA